MRRTVFLLFFLTCGVRAVSAQPAIEMRGAFGASNYLHADLDYTAPTLLVAARLGAGAFAIEPEFASSWHEETQTFGPNVTTVSNDRFQSLAVNLIGRTAGRVAGYAGAGVGMYWERSQYRVNDPFAGYEQSRRRGPRPGAQAIAGVDVTVAPRVKAFAQFRYEMRSFEDPGGGSVMQGFAGVSIVLR
jgi:hypothetical protein